jgi:hypothetical protein
LIYLSAEIDLHIGVWGQGQNGDGEPVDLPSIRTKEIGIDLTPCHPDEVNSFI